MGPPGKVFPFPTKNNHCLKPLQTSDSTERPVAPTESEPAGQKSKESSKDKKPTAELSKQKGNKQETKDQQDSREQHTGETDSIQNGGDTAKETPLKKTEKRQSLGGFFKGLVRQLHLFFLNSLRWSRQRHCQALLRGPRRVTQCHVLQAGYLSGGLQVCTSMAVCVGRGLGDSLSGRGLENWGRSCQPAIEEVENSLETHECTLFSLLCSALGQDACVSTTPKDRFLERFRRLQV